MTSGIGAKTIREIALDAPESVPVFEELKIDYCCGGDMTLEAACAAANVSPEAVETKLKEARNDALPREDSRGHEESSPTELIGYILEKHHVYTREAIERLTPLSDKVREKHAERHQELIELDRLFRQLGADLLPHMQKEELVLFPYIELMDGPVRGESTVARPPFGTVANPIRMMRLEHDTAGSLLKEMRKLTNDYEMPADACPSFRALYSGLEELEKDLHFHIHLENNVLFPKAEQLEKSIQ